MDATDAIIEKIKKAIRLANRTSSEGERDNAIRLAKRIANANGIAFEDIKVSESQTAEAIKEDDESVTIMAGSEIKWICYILREHFGVIVMFNRLKRQSQYARLSWFGSRLNIDIAKYVWHILRRESLKAWQCARVDMIKRKRAMRDKYSGTPVYEILAKDDLVPKSKKGAFIDGFFIAIDQKLTEHPLRNDLEEAKKKAEKKFEDFRNTHNVKDSKVKRNNDSDPHLWQMGMNAGNKVNLSRPCESAAMDRLAITA